MHPLFIVHSFSDFNPFVCLKCILNLIIFFTNNSQTQNISDAFQLIAAESSQNIYENNTEQTMNTIDPGMELIVMYRLLNMPMNFDTGFHGSNNVAFLRQRLIQKPSKVKKSVVIHFSGLGIRPKMHNILKSDVILLCWKHLPPLSYAQWNLLAGGWSCPFCLPFPAKWAILVPFSYLPLILLVQGFVWSVVYITKFVLINTKAHHCVNYINC